MSELTMYQPRDYNGLKDLAVLVVKSSLCNVRTPEDALVIMMTGAELGLSVMQSLRGIHVVKGRPVLSADLMGAVVARSPACEYLRVLEMTADTCTVETKRAGHPEPTRMTWTMEDARRAKLGGDNWAKYPAAMLRARVTAQICRAVYPDLLLGLYTEEELAGVEAEVVSVEPTVHAEVVEAEVVEESPSARLGAALQVVDLETASAFTDIYCEKMQGNLATIPSDKILSMCRKLERMDEDKRAAYITNVVEKEGQQPAA